jgi:glycine cleavage system aminomethyltransferase T/NADPH-dependent 2,4-dienoyl-CoA reductase/sulfur reductase-like enzyme/bacterioferritin-associated ferredoxin
MTFTFNGKVYPAHPGDTIASALTAAGVKTLSRSFKYHRRRGLLCCAGRCPNCLVQIEDEPNVRACIRKVEAGMDVRSQNAWPSLEHDLLSLTQLGSRLTPVGFYYKTFIRPQSLWPLYENVLRHAAGLGKVNIDTPWGKFDKQYLHTDVAVVGGGPAGISAALAAAEQGANVFIFDENPSLGGCLRFTFPIQPMDGRRAFRPYRWTGGSRTAPTELQSPLPDLLEALNRQPNVTPFTETAVLGWYKDNWLSAVRGSRLFKVRAKSLVVATGAYETPLIFDNNDLPGVMLGSAVQRLLHLFGVAPGKQVMVVTANDDGWDAAADLHAMGLTVAAVVDERPRDACFSPYKDGLANAGIPIFYRHTILEARGAEAVRGAVVARLDAQGKVIPATAQSLACDLISISVGWTPATELIYMAGGKLAYNEERSEILPVTLPPGLYVAGRAAGTHALNTQLEEGRLAGRNAALSVRRSSPPYQGGVRGGRFLKPVLDGQGELHPLWLPLRRAAAGAHQSAWENRSEFGGVPLLTKEGLGEVGFPNLSSMDRGNSTELRTLLTPAPLQPTQPTPAKGHPSQEGIFGRHLPLHPCPLPPACGGLGGGEEGRGDSELEEPRRTSNRVIVPGKSKRFVCFCEDVTAEDVETAIAEGYRSIELLKRYSAISMGPCQGKMCSMNAIHLCARANNWTAQETGVTTARPPVVAATLGALAGQKMEPVQVTSIHDWHLERGAKMMAAGLWLRPEHYGAPAAEVRAVRERVGLIDVSPLGKMQLTGPGVDEFLERIYVNQWRKLPAGRVRYGVMCNDEGVVLNDGVCARLEAEEWYMTTTTTGATAMFEWMQWWMQSGWGEGVHLTDLTDTFSAFNLAGPQSRATLQKLTGANLANEAFPYMCIRSAEIAGAPCRLLRIGFTGELSYEIHCPSGYALHVWEALMAAGEEFGIAPFGVEAQRILRLEKAHIIVGQDTDAMSDALSANMEWVVKLNKPDFLGKRALTRISAEGPKQLLAGFKMLRSDIVPDEGAQIVLSRRQGPTPAPLQPTPAKGRPSQEGIGDERARGRGSVEESGSSSNPPLHPSQEGTSSSQLRTPNWKRAEPLEIIGWVTSSRFSPTLGEPIGLCWLPVDIASQNGARFTIYVNGKLEEAIVHHGAFYDPTGERLRT